MATKAELERQVADLTTAYAELALVVRDGERFPPGFDHVADHAANMSAARDLAQVDVRVERDALKQQLAVYDEAAAAKDRATAAGVSEADIEAIEKAARR